MGSNSSGFRCWRRRSMQQLRGFYSPEPGSLGTVRFGQPGAGTDLTASALRLPLRGDGMAQLSRESKWRISRVAAAQVVRNSVPAAAPRCQKNLDARGARKDFRKVQLSFRTRMMATVMATGT